MLLESYDEGWERLFLDGELIYENHSIDERSWFTLLRKLGVTAENRLFDPGEDEDCASGSEINTETPYATLDNFTGRDT